jgi:hypothetical protein
MFNHGYGLFSSKFGGKQWVTTAHRASWIIHNGPIADSRTVVCHKCDNPICVNPDHLFLGSDADNVHDAMRKGRHQVPGNPCYQQGSARVGSKLNEDAVKRMREEYAAGGVTVLQLAKRAAVTEECARHAIKRLTWKHVA